MTKDTKPTGLDLLREPFPANLVSKLPKPTKAQTDAVKADFKAGIRCQVCGQWHHPKVEHLDYVGHAALTDRLLDCDPLWSWEPMAVNDHGVPVFDQFGGMWIRLTVCGHTRLGYGDGGGKSGGNAIKEAIGDALRNAAMRFGAALDLWHKGELHVSDDEPEQKAPAQAEQDAAAEKFKAVQAALDKIAEASTNEDLDAVWRGFGRSVKETPAVLAAAKEARAALVGTEPPF